VNLQYRASPEILPGNYREFTNMPGFAKPAIIGQKGI
jgi:hypothetical protein